MRTAVDTERSSPRERSGAATVRAPIDRGDATQRRELLVKYATKGAGIEAQSALGDRCLGVGA